MLLSERNKVLSKSVIMTFILSFIIYHTTHILLVADGTSETSRVVYSNGV